jgi:uncharacterized membrane protein
MTLWVIVRWCGRRGVARLLPIPIRLEDRLMNQDEINQAEWENPANWTADSELLCVYFSHKDSRTWVPKRNPKMGATLNLGRRSGVAWLVGFMVGIPVIVIVVCVVIMELIK